MHHVENKVINWDHLEYVNENMQDFNVDCCSKVEPAANVDLVQ